MTTQEPCYITSHHPFNGGAMIPTKTVDVISHVDGRIIESLPNTEANRTLLAEKYPQINNNYEA